MRFDGAKYAETTEGPKGFSVGAVDPDVLPDNFTPLEAYDAAASLPSEAPALLRALRESDLADAQGTTEAARDYDAVGDALDQMVLPAPARANLLRALGTIPGVGIDDAAEPDRLGRPVLSVTFDGQAGDSAVRSRWELLLDPVTYAYLGERATALESGRVGGESGPDVADVAPGETWFESTQVSALVDRPGQRP